MPDPGKVPSFTVEVVTDRGVKGYGNGGPGGTVHRTASGEAIVGRGSV